MTRLQRLAFVAIFFAALIVGIAVARDILTLDPATPED